MNLNFQSISSPYADIKMWGCRYKKYTFVISQLENLFRATMKIDYVDESLEDKEFNSFNEAKIYCEQLIK